MTKKRKLTLVIASVITVMAIAVTTITLVCKSYSEPEYTYTAANVDLPDYEKDKFNIDGVLDEEIYKSLRWWSEQYLEGNAQEPVSVKATAYLGKSGLHVSFDVDDDNVNVNDLRSSIDNSGMVLYLAKEGSHKLTDNVWEIEILPNNYINAKRYLGGYYFGTVRADGYKNTPFVKTKTKGGAINTSECKGYVMEAYFPYNFLFENGEIPETLNLNFALQRSYDYEAQSRDLYYNFGQNGLSGWSWSDPGSWWVFNKGGLDSVDLTLNSGNGGALEFGNNYIARYQTEKINIKPDDGYRIVSLSLKNGEEKTDVTDKIKWEKDKNYIKLYNVVENTELDAEFEKIPEQKYKLSGRVTYNSRALTKQETENLSMRFITGGVAYKCKIEESGTYSFDVPKGKGVLQVVAKEGYVAKEIQMNNVSSPISVNINLTSQDYGKDRVVELDDEQIIRNRERIFDASDMISTMNTSFSYEFNLKYTGSLLGKDGTALDDPTFGEYSNEFTGVDFKGEFADEKSKAINGTSFSMQIMHWYNNDMWRIKLTLDYKNTEFFLRTDDLRALGEDGINLRLAFNGKTLTVYQLENGRLFKLFEKDTVIEGARYLKNLDFYSLNNVGHSKWILKEQKLCLGKNEKNYSPIATVANTDGSADFKTSNKTERTALNWAKREYNGVAGFGATIRIPSVLNSSGKIVYNKITSGYWCNTSSTTSKSWYQHNIWIKGDGKHYYIEKTNNKNQIELTEKQIRLLGTTGLDVGWFASGKSIYYFIDDGNGEINIFGDLYDQNDTKPWFPYTNTSNGADLIHNGDEKLGKVYSLSSRAYTAIDKSTTPEEFVTNYWGKKYAKCQTLNPYNFKLDKDNSYFVFQHNDVYENGYYAYNIKTDAVDKNGKIKNTASFCFTTKAWTNQGYYEWRTKLFISGNAAYITWGQGVTPYNSSPAVYYLTDRQIELLGTRGLDIYLSFEDNSAGLKLYADNGYGKLALVSKYDESLFANKTSVDNIRNIYGYAVKFNTANAKAEVKASGCVLCGKTDFATAVKNFENRTVVGSQPVDERSLIIIGSDGIKSGKEKVDLDYLDGNIGGNWLNCFNVKLPGSVDNNGNVIKQSETVLITRQQGDKYYGNNMKLILDENGGKLAIVNYGGNWETYYYFLNKEQLKQIGSNGLNVYVGHIAGENSITVYAENSEMLEKIKTFTYGKNELFAKGYTISSNLPAAEKIDVSVSCLSFRGELLNAIKTFNGNNYKSGDATSVFRGLFEISKDIKPGGSEKVIKEHKAVSDNLLYRFNVKSDAVDANGKVQKSTELKITEFMNKWKKQFHLDLCIKDNVGYIKLTQGDWANWASDSFYLTANQLRQLADEKGMNIFISYDDGVAYIYLQDGENLIKMFSFTQSGLEFLDSRLNVSETKANITVKSEGYTFENGNYLSAINSIIGNKTAEITDVVTYKEVVNDSASLNLENTSASVKFTDMYGNFFYKTVIKDGAVSKSGIISEVSETTAKFNLWGSNWENLFLTVHIDPKGSFLSLTQQNSNSLSAAKVYRLSEEQIKQIGNSGLEIYLNHYGKADKDYSLYISENNLLKLLYTFVTTSDHTYKIDVVKKMGNENTNVSYSLYGYDEKVEFADALGTVSGSEYTVDTSAGSVIFEKSFDSSGVLNSKTANITCKHTDRYGNFFYKTVIKDNAVSKDGKASTVSETTIKYSLWGKDWENIYATVHADSNGGYINLLQQAKGKNFAAITYKLSDSQIKAIGNDGLTVYLNHSAQNDKEYLLYIAEDSVLNYVCAFNTSSDHAYRCEVYKGTNNKSDADKKIDYMLYGYPETVTFAEAAGVFDGNDYAEVFYAKAHSKEQKIGNNERMELKHGNMYNNYFYKLNIASASVDKTGTVKNDIGLSFKCSIWESNYKNIMVYVNLSKDKSEITCKTHAAGVYSNVLCSYQLNEEQLKQIGTDGLEIFVSHSAEKPTDYALWISNGKEYENFYTFKTNGDHSYACEVAGNKLTDKVSASVDIYTYSRMDFSEIIKSFNKK